MTELYFRLKKVGTIDEQEAEFPSYVGVLEYSKEFLDSRDTETCRLKQFIDLQAEYCELFSVEGDISESEAVRLHTELEKYVEFSESSEWRLVRGGKSEVIICPIVYKNSEVSWRL